MTHLGAIIAILIIEAIGAACLTLLCADLRRWSLAAKLGLSFGLGMIALSVALFLASLAGVKPAPWLGGGLLIALVVASVLRRRSWRDWIPARRPRNTQDVTVPLMAKVALLLWLAVVYCQVVAVALLEPLLEWDVLSIWALKASVLTHEPIAATGYFQDLTRAYSHLDYPLLWPLAMSWVWTLGGEVNLLAVKWLAPALLAATWATCFGLVRRHHGTLTALVCTAVLAGLPMPLSQTVRLMADPVLAYFVMACFGCMYLWAVGGRAGDLRLAGVFAAGMLLTKNEGMGYFVVLLVVAGAAWWVRREKRLGRAAAWLIVCPAALSGAWFIFRSGIPKVHENYAARISPVHFVDNLDRVAPVLRGAWTYVGNFEDWLIFWPAVIAIALVTVRRWIATPAALLALPLVLAAMMYGYIYVVSPWDVKLIMETTAGRLLLHLAPLSVLFVAAVYRFAAVRAPRPAAQQADRIARRADAVLFAACLVLFAYFFQGGGWNANSRFDTMRAIVERGTMYIDGFASNTGDVSKYGGHVYANKAPGHAFVGVPFYYVIHGVNRMLERPAGDPFVAGTNAHLLAFFTSGVPASLLAVLLARWFRRQGASIRKAAALAWAFAAGTLVLPFAGNLMSHNLTAMLLFLGWYVITSPNVTRRAMVGAGLAVGLAVLTDFLAILAAVLLTVYVLWQRRPRDVAMFLAGAAPMAAVLLLHNHLCFDNPFTTNYSIQRETFRDSELFLGVFDWPDVRRLYWLSVHPFRGLLYCCPVFVLCILSIRKPRAKRIRAEVVVPLAIFGAFLLFNLCFNGWTGGWGVGPRYLIPALPLLFIFALDGYRRWPRASNALIGVSCALMLCVTAVLAQVPGPEDRLPGDTPEANPILFCGRELAAGRVSISRQSILEPYATDGDEDDEFWDSYNVGELLGLRGIASLLPIAALFAGVYAVWLPRLPDEDASGGDEYPRQGSNLQPSVPETDALSN